MARAALAFARKHRTPLFATEGTFHRLKDRTADKYKKVEWLRLKADSQLEAGKDGGGHLPDAA